MATGVVTWSETAASNATADGNINWAEGMAPSQVNDSARAMMASVALWRDDIVGTALTGGTSTAYTVNSSEGFAALANTIIISLNFHAASGASPTLSVDSLTAKPIYLDGQATVPPVGYFALNSRWILRYSIATGGYIAYNNTGLAGYTPPGTMMMYGATSAPNAGWLLCDGTGYSQTTYANLFAAIGTTYGSTGAGMFSVPDLRARVPVGYDAGSASGRMGGTHTGNISGAASSLGNTGGEENHGLTTAELPTFTPSGTIGGSQTFSNVLTSSGGQNVGSAASPAVNVPGSITVNGSNFSFTGNAIGSGSSHNTVQPSIVVNYIIKT